LTPADGADAGRWVTVGRVGRPHGLAGAFVVEQASDDPGRFARGATVYAGREPASVVDREVPRGSLLELPASELPPAPEGEFYVFELVGLTAVEEGGRVLGRVLDVAPGVANDVLELEGGVALPMVEECVLAVDVEEGRVVIAPGFVPES
jgi:16S rRNA processing protein RimM